MISEFPLNWEHAMKHLASAKDATDPHLAAKRITMAQKFLSYHVEQLYKLQ